MTSTQNIRGFSLIELMVVVIIIGIMAAVAMQSMTTSIADQRRAATEREMQDILRGITGDPAQRNGGMRSDFGYVGDVGAFPPNLDALINNPGLATWSGPYLQLEAEEAATAAVTDEWGNPYAYYGGTTLASTGSGATIAKQLPGSVSDYLHNDFIGQVTDANDSIPATTHQDSVHITLIHPDGGGGSKYRTTRPDTAGYFAFDSIPVGRHEVYIVFEPLADSLQRVVTVLPRHRNLDPPLFRFAASHFSDFSVTSGGSGLSLVPGSVSAGEAGSCDQVHFTIQNDGSSDIEVTSIQLDWGNPEAYYEEITWDGATLFSTSNNRPGSGQVTGFLSPQIISGGGSADVRLLNFVDKKNGSGSSVDMNNVDITVTFSDGSTVDFNTGGCP